MLYLFKYGVASNEDIYMLSPPSFVSFLADQKNGILLDVWRRDGSSFSGRDINIKYHATEETGIV